MIALLVEPDRRSQKVGMKKEKTFATEAVPFDAGIKQDKRQDNKLVAVKYCPRTVTSHRAAGTLDG